MIVSLEQNLLEQIDAAFSNVLNAKLEELDRFHSIGMWYFQKVCARQGVDPTLAMDRFVKSIVCAGAHLADFGWNELRQQPSDQPTPFQIHQACHEETTAMTAVSVFIFLGIMIEGGYFVGLDFNFAEKDFTAWCTQVRETQDPTVPSLFGVDDPTETPRSPGSDTPPVDLPDVPSGDVSGSTGDDGDGEEDVS